MPKPPKKYYSDEKTRHLVDEYTPFLASLSVPTDAVRGIIRALLERIPVQNLNHQAAEEHLMAELLHDNREVEEARKSAQTNQNEDLSASDSVKAGEFMTGLLLQGLGQRRVKTVLEEYASHSVTRMREESDEILNALKGVVLTDVGLRVKWLNSHLPRLLQSLKQKQACYSGCKLRAEWPPSDTADHTWLYTPERGESFGPAQMKDAILGYFHDLSPPRVRDYLEGRRPKTQSRSRPR